MKESMIEQIKALRAKTKAGVVDCKKALQESKGDIEKAEKWLLKKGVASAEKKADRETSEGVVEAYSHMGGKIVGVVVLLCETDFVARTDEFKALAHELAMQVAAMNPKSVDEFLSQVWIRDSKKTIDILVKETIAKTGENIRVKKVARFSLEE
jgi:elongation factor Ts